MDGWEDKRHFEAIGNLLIVMLILVRGVLRGGGGWRTGACALFAFVCVCVCVCVCVAIVCNMIYLFLW